jgi:hypothetical protein
MPEFAHAVPRFTDPLSAALNLVWSHRSWLGCLLYTTPRPPYPASLKEKGDRPRPDEHAKFAELSWHRDGIGRAVRNLLRQAAELPVPAILYVEAQGGVVAVEGGQLLSGAARLVVADCDLVLRSNGADYPLLDISPERLIAVDSNPFPDPEPAASDNPVDYSPAAIKRRLAHGFRAWLDAGGQFKPKSEWYRELSRQAMKAGRPISLSERQAKRWLPEILGIAAIS